jgi:hypothetical protein
VRPILRDSASPARGAHGRIRRSQCRLMCSSIFGMNGVNERPPRRSVAAICEVVTDVHDVTAVYAIDALVRGSSAGERLCPDVARAAGARPADDDGANEGPQSPRELASVAARRADSCRHPVLVPSWRR